MHQLSGVTPSLLRPLLAGDPHLPRLVVYTAGGRTELSTASLANWSAKVAGLLRDELGVVPGDPVVVRLGAGWQTVPILLGCWWVGAVVTDDPHTEAAAAFVPDAAGGVAADVSAGAATDPAADPTPAVPPTAADPQDAVADEVFVVSGHPLGAPSRSVAAHQRDFTGAVLGQADRFVPSSAVPGTAPALTVAGKTSTVDELLATARAAADRFGAGARVFSDVRWHLPDPVIPLVLGTLAADGSLVQAVDHGDAEHLTAVEKCTVRWT